MNAVQIEEAVCLVVAAPFDADELPFAFIDAFGRKGDDDRAPADRRHQQVRRSRFVALLSAIRDAGKKIQSGVCITPNIVRHRPRLFGALCVRGYSLCPP